MSKLGSGRMKSTELPTDFDICTMQVESLDLKLPHKLSHEDNGRNILSFKRYSQSEALITSLIECWCTNKTHFHCAYVWSCC